MSALICREQSGRVGVSLTTSASTTPVINFGEFASGMIFIPSGSSITSLTFHAAPKDQTGSSPAADPTFLALYDVSNAAVTMTVAANRAYPFPASCFAAGALKIVADAAGTVQISLKG